MWSRTVETAVKLGYAVCRGSVDGNVVPAADGTKPTFPVFSERPDVGTTIAAGQHGRHCHRYRRPRNLRRPWQHRHGIQFRRCRTRTGNGFPRPRAISCGVQFLQSGVAGDVSKPAPRNSNCRNRHHQKPQTIIRRTQYHGIRTPTPQPQRPAHHVRRGRATARPARAHHCAAVARRN